MARDVLAEMGPLALGSRLKRLAERMQADATKVFADRGLPIQGTHFPLLAALATYGPLSVTEAVEAVGISQPAVTRIHNALQKMGLTTVSPVEGDSRQKQIRLTPDGATLVNELKRDLWPQVRRAAQQLCEGPDADFLTQIGRVEAALQERSLHDRILDEGAGPALRLVEYDDRLAPEFDAITREWVEDMFTLEEKDIEIIEHPREMIIDRGGVILFVEADGLGIIGTCALMPVDGDAFELTKMGVRASARGLKAGDFLLQRTIERARQLPIGSLFLLTNKKCAAAIHLYEKAGFVHDADIMDRYGKRYARCDVAMSYDLSRPPQG
ncbi:MAG: bifunctional helix-turn-helix transcriptional regulator/GNAT family N-acetyltransferase [Hyphomonas sp.]|nr:bifunctional helix-turn-helix transcriptional regulator/GNAT family N-acetyltransferase [Hyphomonas sp.]